MRFTQILFTQAVWLGNAVREAPASPNLFTLLSQIILLEAGASESASRSQSFVTRCQPNFSSQPTYKLTYFWQSLFHVVKRVTSTFKANHCIMGEPRF